MILGEGHTLCGGEDEVDHRSEGMREERKRNVMGLVAWD
jgi:hypothetical protein